ncbi:8-oxo-dGTP pyrophosphatase MutT (NUDIX family) [Rhodobium orientis]|uniref:CoA pyrophosphatase n=1 Tax=Rhodobium orientis TaxID=34017 RepID=A0A327JVC1_9HYPH|nr:CoA pyrophosphatase [Rhodobium orientis]MBB4301211.1 8-oxo-dGTP pyrophosphatase MutT (NUDIX family) [Rhodobium orientis]MBK5951197.1 CoA pyrophosphatase [Rhodobium orientis]RAI30021.1 CoA pyrophosphatase [Rhodobium orientis]
MSLSTDIRPFSVADFRARVARLSTHGDGEAGDHLIDPALDRLHDRHLRDAAVLVPVVAREPEATVLLTVRTEHLPSHAGQIAFPGGKIDDGDRSALHAALREAEEEIGLVRDVIEPIGQLEPYVSNSGFRIVPVLSVVAPDFTLTINEHEVADAFEVPLSFLMTTSNHRRSSKIHEGLYRMFYEMPYGDRYIWGVTAGILRRIYERLYGDEA